MQIGSHESLGEHSHEIHRQRIQANDDKGKYPFVPFFDVDDPVEEGEQADRITSAEKRPGWAP